jgi:hypothetical protein
MLNGADTCRRCRTELHKVQEVERQAQLLGGAAMHRLALDDTMAAGRLLRRAIVLHATPELRALWQLVQSRAK